MAPEPHDVDDPEVPLPGAEDLPDEVKTGDIAATEPVDDDGTTHEEVEP